MPTIGPAAEKRVVRGFAERKTVRGAAAFAGVSFKAARRTLRAAGLLDEASPFGDNRVAGSDDAETREYTSDREVRTLEDAVVFAKVDLSVWRVARWECTGWNVGMKLREFDRGKIKAETPVKRQLWRVKLVLERLLPKPVHDALESVCRRIREAAPPPPEARKCLRSGTPVLAVADLVDVHFGKLAWAPEAGQNYDLRIADAVYRDAVGDMLAVAAGFDVEEFLLPLGSDFLHVDNAGGTTTAGTPQDVDGRLAKIVETATMAVVFAVAAMAERAPVVVRWVPGNHDRTLSYMIAHVVAARFHADPRVTVDHAPTTRKYHRYHSTLIGLTHGNEEKHSSLPVIMATERPAEWAATTCREWHLGHRHTSKRVDYVSLDTHGGVPVRTLRSLSAVDAWHYKKGYVGANRAAEMYVYGRQGYLGHFISNVIT